MTEIFAVPPTTTGDGSRSEPSLQSWLQAEETAAVLFERIHETLAVHQTFVSTQLELGHQVTYGSRDQAAMIVDAVLDAVRPREPMEPVPDQVLAAKVAALEYKDWEFSLTRVAGDDRRWLKVAAKNPDTRDPSKTFEAGRSVPIVDSVESAALFAVMLVELHEVRERLRMNGRQISGPHYPYGPPPRHDHVPRS